MLNQNKKWKIMQTLSAYTKNHQNTKKLYTYTKNLFIYIYKEWDSNNISSNNIFFPCLHYWYISNYFVVFVYVWIFVYVWTDTNKIPIYLKCKTFRLTKIMSMTRKIWNWGKISAVQFIKLLNKYRKMLPQQILAN